MRIKKEKITWKPIKEDKETMRLYQLHHMHHFNKNKKVAHEIHHCYVFPRRNVSGKKYEIYHALKRNHLWHCLKLKTGKTAPDTVYDHAKRIYKIKPIKIYEKIHYRII